MKPSLLGKITSVGIEEREVVQVAEDIVIGRVRHILDTDPRLSEDMEKRILAIARGVMLSKTLEKHIERALAESATLFASHYIEQLAPQVEAFAREVVAEMWKERVADLAKKRLDEALAEVFAKLH